MAAPRLALPLRPLAWACAAFAGGVLLHLDRVPPWASVASFALIFWGRLAAARRHVWLPGALARALLALGMAAVALARFHTLNGLAAGTTLLLLMAALKLLETRNPRDELVLVGAGLLPAARRLPGPPAAGAHAAVRAAGLGRAAAAIGFIATPALGARAAVRLAGRALLIAAPLAVSAVCVLPAAAGGVLGDSARQHGAHRPVNPMPPGSIMQLVADYSTAFRVRFAGTRPSGAALYWRGPVLHDFDGRTWRPPAEVSKT